MRSYLNFVFYMTIAELAVFSSLAAAALISYCPPPRTFSCLFGADRLSSLQAVLDTRSEQPACHGKLCTFCPLRCFLHNGMLGECEMLINSGGRIIWITEEDGTGEEFE